MKKLIYFFLTFSVAFLLPAEEVFVDHPVTGEEVRLVVPDNYDDLREAYLQMADLYLGERHDLEEALTVIDDQKEIVEDAEETIKELRESNQSLSDTLEAKIRPQPIRLGVIAGYAPRPMQDVFPISVGAQLMLFERGLVGLEYNTAQNFVIKLGYVLGW